MNMAEEAPSEPEQGQWVRVWAQVLDHHAHPEDLAVRMWSHTEDYPCAVRRTYVEVPKEQPEWAARCSSLDRLPLTSFLSQCEKGDRHDGLHLGGGREWSDAEAAGRLDA